ncbi:hypothetical protein GOEFS_054_00150 [Gordonia effusa NBRC 100432]|uniref:CYTH domain-containing protein n=1 Tax=Gordonia effusa NBRC 100432 TaxID=1077974 RepID=H0R001_9ACTN|nr:hypothetical protein [Gordonia effusa]GAB18402.1 hypothetical protein GOEFS_054_00150 [Gordonia effusa NBRC 100432]
MFATLTSAPSRPARSRQSWFRSVAVAAAASFAITVAPLTAGTAEAAANATPSFEVKLNLNATALSSNAPSSAVRSKFGLGANGSARAYEYLDTDALDLNGEGWSVRLRNKDGDPLELNYKKRFAVSGTDLNGSLTTANQAGFDANETSYDAEVDWGLTRMTLSFSNDKDPGINVDGIGMPSSQNAIAAAVNKIPGKLKDWRSSNWGKTTLQASRVHGPVTSTEWSGTFEGAKSALEILPIHASGGQPAETVVELSFKAADFATAKLLRDHAIAIAQANGWLLGSDVLKTNLILTRY